MSQYEKQLRQHARQRSVEETDVAVADARCTHVDNDLVCPGKGIIALDQLQWLARGGELPCLHIVIVAPSGHLMHVFHENPCHRWPFGALN